MRKTWTLPLQFFVREWILTRKKKIAVSHTGPKLSHSGPTPIELESHRSNRVLISHETIETLQQPSSSLDASRVYMGSSSEY